jgi:hypothetical protein
MMIYEKVPQDDEESDSPRMPEYSQRGERIRTALLSANLVLFLAVLIFYLVTIVQRLRSSGHASTTAQVNQPVEQYPEECGDSVEEAIAKNCPLDVMSNLWTPQRCYNETFALEALRGVDIDDEQGGVGAPEFGLGVYEWFEDEDLSRPIDSANALEQFLLKQDKRGLPLEAYTHMSCELILDNRQYESSANTLNAKKFIVHTAATFNVWQLQR